MIFSNTVLTVIPIYEFIKFDYHVFLLFGVIYTVFLLLSNQYCNPEQGIKPRCSSECLLEFDTSSKPLGHHGRLLMTVVSKINDGKRIYHLTVMKSNAKNFYLYS